MPYMRKNVNLILLLLIVVAMLGVAGLTSYYHTSYRKLSVQHNTKLQELATLNVALQQNKSELNRTITELTLRKQEVRRFDVLYENLTDVNEGLEGDLKQTRTELVSTITRLKATEADLKASDEALTKKKAEADRLNEEIVGYRKSISTLSSQISSLQNEVCSLKTELGRAC